MDADRVVNLSDLEGLTPDEVMSLLDISWTGLLAPIGEYLEQLWNQILTWLTWVVDWIYDRIKPLIDTVWGWLQSGWDWMDSRLGSLFSQVWSWIQGIIAPIVSSVTGLFSQVWSWILSAQSSIISGVSVLFSQVYSWLSTGFSALTSNISIWFSSLMSNIKQFAIDIGQRVSAINTWFSTEFIDPFLDWLVKLPANLWAVFITALGTVWTGITNNLKFVDSWWASRINKYLPGVMKLTGSPWDFVRFGVLDLVLVAVTAVIALIPEILAGLGGVFSAIGSWIAAAVPAILGWLGGILGDLGIWIGLYAEQFGAWALTLLPRLGGWFTTNIISLLGSGAILTAAATGKLEVIVDKFVSPAIASVFDHFEKMGPVAPMSGAGMSESVGKLATFTIAGLAGMTLAGEMLSPLKHIGLGHISAVIYDLINYKTLTAAFMGVLAFVYIKTPLTYYYNRAARPNLPDERGLGAMLEDRAITPAVYRDNMAWQGYTDAWIEKIEDTLYRPMTPYMLRSLAEAGLLDDDLLEHALNHAGYDDISKVAIKKMMNTLSAGSLTAVSSGTAMSRYQEGFDDESSLRKNLSVLGVADAMLDRYVFAAQLKYLYDYQTDLKTFYIDEYHRRVIEEPELRSDLAATGFSPERLDLVVQQQKIKRLAAAAAAADPALTIELETIRARRKKSLTTRTQEIEQMVTLGYELPYATAIADNDDVAMTPSGAVIVPVVLLAYETEAGKVEVDTIRRSTRSRQMSAIDELAALKALEMPIDLAQAIVDNDSLRLVKQAAA